MMVQFYFGPDKIPFRLNDKGMVEKNSTMPFHGIISRGLLNRFIAKDIKGEKWHQYAHILFDENSCVSDSDLEILRSDILECKVLSFDQSALCVKEYVEQSLIEQDKKDVQIELWNIKEGHTSSVWKTSVISDGKEEIFVVNVARDYDAGIELKKISEKLVAIENAFPDINLAKVIEISSVKCDTLPFLVTVTRNEWVNDSWEIHCRKNKINGKDELLLIERFLRDNNDPSKITSVVGRIFSDIETKTIYEYINHFLTKAATCLTEKPLLNINHGDIVWDGEKAVIVAIS